MSLHAPTHNAELRSSPLHFRATATDWAGSGPAPHRVRIHLSHRVNRPTERADDALPVADKPVTVSLERQGQLARIRLMRAGNVLDAERVDALRRAVHSLYGSPALKLVVFEGAGAHFSAGASLTEQLPATVRSTMAGLHALFDDIDDLGVATAAIVRGSCLGPGFELATACNHVVCDPTARFGIPEVGAGLPAPLAHATLCARYPGRDATQRLLTGHPIEGIEAAQLGLADDCSEDPESALQRWFERSLAAPSAASLRFALRAAKRPIQRPLAVALDGVQAQYLDALMMFRHPQLGLPELLTRATERSAHRGD